MYEESKVTWNLIWDVSSKFQVIRFGLVWFGKFCGPVQVKIQHVRHQLGLFFHDKSDGEVKLAV